MKCEVSQANDV